MSELVKYQAESLENFQVLMHNETVWLTQAQMVILIDKNKRTISEHISNIFKERELEENSAVRNFRTAGADGKNHQTPHHSFDVIISVGYRVKSLRGTQCSNEQPKRAAIEKKCKEKTYLI